jgi:hypothetical protein
MPRVSTQRADKNKKKPLVPSISTKERGNLVSMGLLEAYKAYLEPRPNSVADGSSHLRIGPAAPARAA